jgi:hypothetical protein
MIAQPETAIASIAATIGTNLRTPMTAPRPGTRKV